MFCDGASAPAGAPGAPQVAPGEVPAPARVCLVDDPDRQLFTGIVGGYGKVTGARSRGGVRGRAPAGDSVPDGVQAAAGYVGEGLILEATRLGLGTCWVAGTFDSRARTGWPTWRTASRSSPSHRSATRRGSRAAASG